MTRLEEHPDVRHVDTDRDGHLVVHVPSRRQRVIRRVLDAAVDAGHVPRETRRHRHGVALVLARDVADLPLHADEAVLAC